MNDPRPPCRAAMAIIGLACVVSTALFTSYPAVGDASLIPKSGFPDSIGMVVHGFPSNPGELDMIARAGVRLVRTNQLDWNETELEKGKYDFTKIAAIDKFVNAFPRRGITVMGIIKGGNLLYGMEPFGAVYNDEQIAAFARFAAAAAARYKGKPVMFEMGNEPDGTNGPTPERYVAWATAAVTAMQKVNPKVCIVGPAAHIYAPGWMEECFKLGLLDLLDGVTIHLYIWGPDPDGPCPMPEESARRVADIRKLVAKYAKGRDLPVIDSEWGFNRLVQGMTMRGGYAVSTETQARYLARAFLLGALWDIRSTTYYCWNRDPGPDLQSDFGIVTDDAMPYSAYYAMKNLNDQLPGARLKGRIAVGSDDDYVLEFTTAKGPRWALWTTGKAHSVRVPVGNCRKVFVSDMCGATTYDLPVTGGVLTIQVDGAPRYLRRG